MFSISSSKPIRVRNKLSVVRSTTSTPIRKVRQYRVTAKGRVLQEHFLGIDSFVVLIVTSNPTRAKNIVRECQKVEGGWKNIWVTDVETLLHTPFLEIPWYEGKTGYQITIESVVKSLLTKELSNRVSR